MLAPSRCRRNGPGRAAARAIAASRCGIEWARRYSATTSVGSRSPASRATSGAKTRYSSVPTLASPRSRPRVAVSLPPSSPGTSVRTAIPTTRRSYAERPPAARGPPRTRSRPQSVVCSLLRWQNLGEPAPNGKDLAQDERAQEALTRRPDRSRGDAALRRHLLLRLAAVLRQLRGEQCLRGSERVARHRCRRRAVRDRLADLGDQQD